MAKNFQELREGMSAAAKSASLSEHRRLVEGDVASPNAESEATDLETRAAVLPDGRAVKRCSKQSRRSRH